MLESERVAAKRRARLAKLLNSTLLWVVLVLAIAAIVVIGQARQRAKVDAGLAELDRCLGERQWLVGDSFGLADITAGSALAYVTLRLPDHPWRATHPRLAVYSDRLEQRPSFARSRPAPQTIVEIG